MTDFQELRHPRDINDIKDGEIAIYGSNDGGTTWYPVDVNTDGELGVRIQQDVREDPNNSSTTNLDSGNSHTFTGTGASTLGVVGLQWNLKTDQNAIVYIEQSDDNENWDLSDHFDYVASLGGNGGTVQAVTAYWRIRVVLTGTTDTTYFRLKGILCPIAEPLPRALSDDFRLKTESTLTGYENPDRHVWISPTNTLTVNPQVRLVGHSFSGSTKDTSFWGETVTNGGTVDQVPGEVKITTNTTADGTARYYSKHSARFVAGHPNLFTAGVSFKTALTANNIRRIGAYDGTEGVDGDGYYFELDYLTFCVGTRKAGTDTRVATGSFNGKYGDAWVPTADTYYQLSIEMTPMGTWWYVNGILLHKTISGHQTGTITLPITMECNNDNSSTADVEMHVIGSVVMREAELTTESIYYHLSGNSATHILKYGAGTLHKIMFNNTSGTTLTIYDNTAGSGAVIGVITTASGAIGEWSYDVPFSTGLTLVTTGNSLDATIVYE